MSDTEGPRRENQDRTERERLSFDELFIAEIDGLTIRADMPAAAVLGECTRAAKRAQMAFEREEATDGR